MDDKPQLILIINKNLAFAQAFAGAVYNARNIHEVVARSCCTAVEVCEALDEIKPDLLFLDQQIDQSLKLKKEKLGEIETILLHSKMDDSPPIRMETPSNTIACPLGSPVRYLGSPRDF